MKKLTKIAVLVTLISIFMTNPLNSQLADKNNDTSTDRMNNIKNSGLGILDTNNFIPESGANFLDGWTYPGDQSYNDTFWGSPTEIFDTRNTQYKSVMQIYSKNNDHISDVRTVVDGSEDFNTRGFGSISLNPAVREREFYTNDSDVHSTNNLTIKEFTPNPTGNIGGYNATSYWFYDGTSDSNNYYPANTNGSLYFFPDNSETWNWANVQQTPTRRIISNTLGSDSRTLEFEMYRKSWWSMCWPQTPYNGKNNQPIKTANITAKWDTTTTYSVELNQNFYYNGTSNSTVASYKAEVNILPIGDLEKIYFTEGEYNVLLTGSISFSIYNNTLGNNSKLITGPSYSFYDKDDGNFNQENFILTGSDNFGNSLTPGWYYLAINVTINHRSIGNLTEQMISKTNLQVESYGSYTNGINVKIKNPCIEIKESTPIVLPSEGKEILIDSSDIAWGEGRSVNPGETPSLTFGYQVPTTLKGVSGGSQTLEYGKVIARLWINHLNGTTFNHTREDTLNFKDVWNVDSSYGNSCAKFNWTMDEVIISQLNGANNISWQIGIIIRPGLEIYRLLSNPDYTLYRVYFNNINFTVATNVKFKGTFALRNPLNDLENDLTLNFSFFNNEDYFTKTTTNGVVEVKGLYNDPWRVLVNFTASDGLIYVIANYSLILNEPGDFTKNVSLNLTNIIYKINDLDGGDIGENALVQLKSLSNPSDIRIAYTNSSSHVLFKEVYNGNWQMIVNVTQYEQNLTIFNATKEIKTTKYVFPQDRYLIQDPADTVITCNLSNIRLTLLDPIGSQISGGIVTFRNLANTSIVKTATSNSTGVAILREISNNSNWQIVVTRSGYTVYNSSYYFNTPGNFVEVTKMVNLTNQIITVQDYISGTIDNAVNPIAILSHAGYSPRILPISNGIATFTEVWNSTGWSLMVNVTVLGELYTVYNSPFLIATENASESKSITINYSSIEFIVTDLDAQVIPNATVYLNNPSESYSQMKVADAQGKVLFRSVYALSNWNLTVKYTAQGKGAIDQTVFQIYNLDALTISPQNKDYRLSQTISNCNLTTLNFWVLSKQRNDTNFPYPNANVTVKTVDGSKVISTYNSSNALESMKLPSDTYNFSVVFDGFKQKILFNDSIEIATENKLRSITQLNTTRILIDETGYPTSLEIVSWNYANPSWPHETQFEIAPYYINMYYNDTINFTIRFYRLDNNDSIINDVEDSSWKITSYYDKNTILNSSASYAPNVPAMDPDLNGNYDFPLKSNDYVTGDYEITFTFKKAGYITSIMIIRFTILNYTSKLENLNAFTTSSVNWGTNASVWVNYTTVLPEITGIMNATVSFNVAGTAISGLFSYNTPGIYSMNFSTSNLVIGEYRVDIYASRGNISANFVSIYITVMPLTTTSASFINQNYSVGLNAMKVSYGENVTILFNYTYSNNSAVNGADYSIYLDEIPITTFYPMQGNYMYNITFEANLYPVGAHVLHILSGKINHVNQTININIQIMSSWATTTVIITPPGFTPWSSNASFVIEYSSIETPRNGWKLTNATISQITVTYLQESVEYTWGVYPASSTNVWGYNETGNGKYLIWFNTSYLRITENTFFYIKPLLSLTVYANAIPQPYVWVSPLRVSLYDKVDGENLDQLNMFFGQVKTIDVYLNVTEATSLLIGKMISNAQVTYNIYEGENVIAAGFLISRGNGHYNMSLTASRLGDYKVKIFMTLTNYSIYELPAEFTWSIKYTPVSFRTTIDPSIRTTSTSMKISKWENIKFEIVFLEQLTEVVTLTVNMSSTNFSTILPVSYDLQTKIYSINTLGNYTPNEYQITISAEKEYTDTVVQKIDLTILDFWPTGVELIDPPTVYPWNNISSFIFRYYCIESPRSNLMLSQAGITALNITYVTSEGEFSEKYLTQADIGNKIWNWTNLATDPNYGPGYYFVWVNTSILTIDEGRFFYLIPTINQTVYAENRIRPYVWIKPVESKITILKNNIDLSPKQTFELYLDQSMDISIRVNVTDMASILFDTVIDDAIVTFDMFDGDSYVRTGTLINEGNGIYSANFPAITIGTFIVDVYATKLNFTIEVASFEFIVKEKQILLSNSIGIKNGATLSVPQNREYGFSIDLLDDVANSSLLGAKMNVTIGDKVFTFEEDPLVPGRYTANFTAEQIAQFMVGSYVSYVEIYKTNYTSYTLGFSFEVTDPVDPIFNFPLPYWRMGIIVASVMAAVYVVQKSIRYARIPLFVKQVDLTKKIIAKKRSLQPGKIAPQMADEIGEKYGYIWELLDLNIAELLKPADNESGSDFLTPADSEKSNEGGIQ